MNPGHTVKVPRDLAEAIDRLMSLISETDRRDFSNLPDHLLIAKLHLTLGHQIRAELGLWGNSKDTFIEELSKAMPDYPVWDADSASAALILLMKRRITLNSIRMPTGLRQ